MKAPRIFRQPCLPVIKYYKHRLDCNGEAVERRAIVSFSLAEHKTVVLSTGECGYWQETTVAEVKAHKELTYVIKCKTPSRATVIR